MNRTLLSILLASALMPLAIHGQLPPPIRPSPPGVPQPGGGSKPSVEEIRFDLDFPGGNPKEFVAAIDHARPKLINAIVPDDCMDVQIPPLKMTDVTVGELFRALQMASLKSVKVLTGTFEQNEQYQFFESSFGFESSNRQLEDNCVWYFRVKKPMEPTPIKEICRFYQLETLLEKNRIEDITTAIQSGWEMLHVTKVPQLKYHPETKLLIAVGSEENLRIIESVLEQLRPRQPAIPAMPRPLLPAGNLGTPK